MADPTPVYTPPPPRKKPRGTTTPRTRMAGALVPIPKVYTPEVDKVKKAVKKPKKRVVIKGKPPIDDQFAGEIFFSPAFGTDAGRTYGAMLDNPVAGKEYYWRCRIEQHRVDPLLQGFETRWDPPPGWTFVDGHGSIRYHEAISNPLVITRVVKAPGSPNSDIGFLVDLVAKYKP